MPKRSLGLFEAFGIELEYMVVDKKTLRPAPIAEEILLDENGETTQEISLGPIDVSNELATHVLEFKSSGPVSDLDKLEQDFAAAIKEMNSRLASRNAMLAPGGIHPFMDPTRESGLWSKGDRSIYDAYNEIFDCRRHGWLNLQSCHLNLPFANDDEFARLHAAIIIVLPYLSALSASSPFIEGRHEGYLDTRLKVYSSNQAKIPQIAGKIVPEPVFTCKEYENEILQPLYKAIAPHDPKGLLQYEWLNSRGAIARFDRNAIEIRVLDTQECPKRDITICRIIIAVLQKLCAMDPERLKELARRYTPEQRRQQFMSVAENGHTATAELSDIREAFGIQEGAISVGQLWVNLVEQVGQSAILAPLRKEATALLATGPVAQRLLAQYSSKPDLEDLQQGLTNLANCLQNNTALEATSHV